MFFVNAAHNDYVQVLGQTGVIGFAAVRWCGLSQRFIVPEFNVDGDWSRALGLAGLVGCTNLLVHSVFDSNLQIPANASLQRTF